MAEQVGGKSRRAPGQVWVDAQLPPALALWLGTDCGIGAIHVKDLGLLHADDTVIFQAACAAAVVVMTKDQDFIKLLDRLGPPPQVVWVTCGNIANQDLRRLIIPAWPAIAELLAQGDPLVEISQRR